MLSCNLQFYRFFTGFPPFMLQPVNCSTRWILSLALGYPGPASCRRKACKNQLKAASASVAMQLYLPGLQIRDIATETEGLKWPPEIGPKADVIAFFVAASCVWNVTNLLRRCCQDTNNAAAMEAISRLLVSQEKDGLDKTLQPTCIVDGTMFNQWNDIIKKRTPHWVLASFLRNKSQLFLFEILCSLEILPEKVMDLEGSVGCQPFNYTGLFFSG